MRFLRAAHVLQVALEHRGHAHVVAHDVPLVREITREAVDRSVGLLDVEPIAVELPHLGRERKTEVVPARLLTLAELVGLRALAKSPKRGDLGKCLVFDAGLDDRGDGLKARVVAEERFPVGNLEALDFLRRLDFLLRRQHPMADHLAEIAGERRVPSALALELLQRLFTFDACLLELLLAGLGRRGRCGSGLRGSHLGGLRLDLRLLLGCLGANRALTRRLSCRCLSCHVPLAFRWRPQPVAPRPLG